MCLISYDSDLAFAALSDTLVLGPGDQRTQR